MLQELLSYDQVDIHKPKLKMQKAMEDMKKGSKMVTDKSNEYQQTMTEIQSGKHEVNTVKDACDEVQETVAAMENK